MRIKLVSVTIQRRMTKATHQSFDNERRKMSAVVLDSSKAIFSVDEIHQLEEELQ
jgi:hypothetical protein